MGMFDEITWGKRIFQTKDLDCVMDDYAITGNGHLPALLLRRNTVFHPDVFEENTFLGHTWRHEKVKCYEWRYTHFTGQFRMYGYKEEDPEPAPEADREWQDFLVTVQNGVVTSVEDVTGKDIADGRLVTSGEVAYRTYPEDADELEE